MLKKITTFFTLAFLIFANVAHAQATVPNDQLYAQQRAYLEQIKLPAAWSRTIGSDAVVVAVIDSGVDTDHPDIIGNMWFNPGEIPLNGLDDNNNGYIDDLNGWDFLTESSDSHPKFTPGYSFSGINHGTAVAGVIAAVTNNAEGVAGVCWNCKIMALRALDARGEGDTGNIARAIDYAIANGADVINMSFVGAATDTLMSEAIARAHAAGIVLVAAAGNDAEETFLLGGDLDLRPLFPVCTDGGAGENWVVGVTSVGLDNKKSQFANFGFTCLDVAAPGDGITAPQVYDPRQGEDFSKKYKANWRGTSVAAPFAAGVAALLKSVNPKLTPDQIIGIIRDSATDISGANPTHIGELGAGLLNADRAVALALGTIGQGTGLREPVRSTAAVVDGDKRFFVSSGQNRLVDVLRVNKAGETDLSIRAYPDFFRGGAEVVAADVTGNGQSEIIVGAGAGGGPQVRVFNANGEVISQFFAYDPSFRGGVRVAAGDTNKDGLAEIITSAGAGLSSTVKIFSYRGELRSSFTVTAPGLNGGITVQAADLDNDGVVEIITGTGGGSLPLVQIFDTLGQKRAAWLAYPEFFRGGVNVAAGDVNGDGSLEIVTAAGVGGGPQIRVFDAAGSVLGQFFAFENTFRGGARVTVADIDNDAQAEIIVGAGPGRAAEVRTFGKFGASFVQESVFSVFEESYQGGVNVGR